MRTIWIQTNVHEGMPVSSACTHNNIAPSGDSTIPHKKETGSTDRYSKTYVEHRISTLRPHTKLKQYMNKDETWQDTRKKKPYTSANKKQIRHIHRGEV